MEFARRCCCCCCRWPTNWTGVGSCVAPSSCSLSRPARELSGGQFVFECVGRFAVGQQKWITAIFSSSSSCCSNGIGLSVFCARPHFLERDTNWRTVQRCCCCWLAGKRQTEMSCAAARGSAQRDTTTTTTTTSGGFMFLSSELNNFLF